MRVVVTGGSGLLGSNVVKTLLARGHDVLSLDVVEARTHDAEARVLDLLDQEGLAEAVTGADAIVHTAAIIDLHLGAPNQLDDVNVEGTRNVVVACRTRGVGRLVHVSSAEVIAGLGSLHAATEADAVYPRPHLSHYGATKEQAERLVLDANGPDLATCATRTFGLYGEGDRTVVPMYLARLPGRTIRIVGRGTGRTDVVYAPNVAHALALAAEQLTPSSPWAGSALHVTDGEPVEIQRFLAELVEPLGYALNERQAVPAAVAEATARLYELRYRLTGAERWARPRLTRHSLRLTLGDYYLDSTRIRTELGYEPPVDRPTAISRTQEWLASRYPAPGRGG